MRYYEARYPEVDELVMVQVRQIAEMGAYVKLLEYDNIEGMILLSELSRRRIRSIQKLIRVGRNEVVVVLRVDKEKGYIDLSKRRVSPEDITKCEERFMKARTVSSIMRHGSGGRGGGADTTTTTTPAGSKKGKDHEKHGEVTATTTDEVVASLPPPSAAVGPTEEERLEKLYEHIAWPLGRKYGNVYDAFKLALTESDAVFATLPQPVPQATYGLLMATIARRLTPQPVKLRADIELTCYTPTGIEAIKKALRAGEEASTEAVPIKAKLVAPPLYVLSTNATDKYAAVERLERAIESIQGTIEKLGGNLLVKMKPKAVSETDEQDLAQLMAKAGRENAEVSGDEDEEEALG
ncbi:eukaryotic translation initiation factor 2 alpha subunit-domain-containing protein [Lactifluus volemus]|nr:eukaryotic translation initiation factor 2 alpha subunit-domain-containing protein [Lactifluus volemus]